MKESANSLAIIQAKVKAPKGQFNSFGKYYYRSAEDILEAVKLVINPMGFSIYISDTIIQIGDRYYIQATATLTDGKETYVATAYAREEESKKGMDGSQVTGASSSYARKYALNGLFALDDTKDSDATNTHDKEPPKAEVKPFTLSANEMGELAKQLRECTELEHLTEYWNDMDSNWKALPIVKNLFSKRKQDLTQ